MIIRFGDLESDKPSLKGELGVDIFQLEGDSDIKSIGPVTCDLETSVSGDHLIVTGSLSVPAQLRCVGCLENFPYLIDDKEYHAEIAIEDGNVLDMTEYIRDDILLEIPNYPRCQEGSETGRVCPMQGPFSCESKGIPSKEGDSGEKPSSDVWDALENLDTGDH